MSVDILTFLEEAHFPSLDKYMSQVIQSTILEVLFWTLAYLLYVQLFSTFLRSLFRRTKIWTNAKNRVGVFLGNGRDDAVLLTCLAFHHGFAALLMYLGVHRGEPLTWRHGYLVETGFEVADYVAMGLKLYPYESHDGMKDDIKAALIAHHIPGISLAGFVMTTGLYENIHMQEIVLALLGGAFVSCLCAVYTYTLSFQHQMTQAAIVFNINFAYFIYCRWWIFPTESLALLNDVKSDPAFGGVVIKLLYAGGVLMALFNIGICVDMIPKSIRYIRRAIDGKTPIDTEPIPSSRDSILYGGRSSIKVAVDAMNVSNRARRASVATIMGLNAVDDLVRTTNAISEDDEGIDADDLKALNKTLSSISSKKGD